MRYDKWGDPTMSYLLWGSGDISNDDRSWLDIISSRTKSTLKFSDQARIESLFYEIFGHYGVITKSGAESSGLSWDDVSKKLVENGWGNQKSPTKIYFTRKFINELWDNSIRIFGEKDYREIRAFSISREPEVN